MSRRRRWTPLVLALAAGAAAWVASRFLPRDWLDRCRDGARGGRSPAAEPGAHTRSGGAATSPRRAPAEEPPTEPSSAPAETLRCAAVTVSGRRCSREVEVGSLYCWQHAPS